MTGPEDSHSSTRPISVAELLAKNGTIGAPPVGGRRRRRRGDSDAVTVAELTGEIPIVTGHDVDRGSDTEATTTLPVVPDEPPVEPADAVSDVADESDAVDLDDDVDDDYADAVADYTAHVEDRDADVDLDFFAPPRRSAFASRRLKGADVDWMGPQSDNALDDVADEAPAADVDDDNLADEQDDRDELPSYLRSSSTGTLFGGPSVADDLARRRLAPGPEDLADLDDAVDDETDTSMSSVTHAAWVVGQCVLAVAFGAGLFIAFDQLWKWNNIVALVLSVLVILGLVVGVRVVRKTEDIGSTLIAVAVGALVTLGPLALLQSG